MISVVVAGVQAVVLWLLVGVVVGRVGDPPPAPPAGGVAREKKV